MYNIYVLVTGCICFTGYYCPNNTEFATQYACPVGTFNNVTHRVSVTQCQTCAAGMYCDTTGLSTPAGECDAGK